MYLFFKKIDESTISTGSSRLRNGNGKGGIVTYFRFPMYCVQLSAVITICLSVSLSKMGRCILASFSYIFCSKVAEAPRSYAANRLKGIRIGQIIQISTY